jgi:hypothetical protein
MATLTKTPGQRFPVGTLVGAYPQSNWLPAELPPTGAAKGSATASGTVAADGSLTITGLPNDADYFLGKADGSTGYIKARTNSDPSNAVINTAVSGALTVIPGIPGHRIIVSDYAWSSASAQQLTWRSGSTDISGAMPVAANGGFTGRALLTLVGDSLVLFTSAAGQVGGHVTYTTKRG